MSLFIFQFRKNGNLYVVENFVADVRLCESFGSGKVDKREVFVDTELVAFAD